jgi:hypothetical protein
MEEMGGDAPAASPGEDAVGELGDHGAESGGVIMPPLWYVSFAAGRGRWGTKSLLGASYAGHAERVEAMLEGGVHPNAPEEANDAGQSPLMLAAAHGHEAVVGLLLEYGAKVDAETEHVCPRPWGCGDCGGWCAEAWAWAAGAVGADGGGGARAGALRRTAARCGCAALGRGTRGRAGPGRGGGCAAAATALPVVSPLSPACPLKLGAAGLEDDVRAEAHETIGLLTS